MRSLMWRGLPGAPMGAKVPRSHVLLTWQARRRAVSSCHVVYIYRLASWQEDA